MGRLHLILNQSPCNTALQRTALSLSRCRRAGSGSFLVFEIVMPTPLQALHHPYTRYGAIFISVILTLHLLASFSSPSYSSTTAAARARLGLGGDEIGASHYYKGHKRPAGWEPSNYAEGNDLSTLESGGGNGTRANAAFVVLARNSDVWEILSSIRGMEGEP